MRDVIWDDIKITDSVNHSYNRFLQIFLSLYNECFPKTKIKLKSQKHFRPWITLGIRKSSKRKQKLYEKFLKTRNAKKATEHNAYKNMFEIIKYKSKRNYHSQKILEYKNNAKRWNIMKEVLDKTNKPGSRLPTKLVIKKRRDKRNWHSK